ncbi:MAG: peptidoglycan bridge formation glycyltransferase FemA/FemB family protein [Candidatus Uhrbacteria bacterium]|nr:peptidoglycan bridge formation glycyltransferase FemA/FemB family protein [Candidatus Uhrbacteria bacterium]
MDDLNRKTWNGYMASKPHAQFLQSWEWGELQRALGLPAHFLFSRTAHGDISECGLFLEIPLFAGKTYLYCPRGPVEYFSDSLFDEVQKFCNERFSTKKNRPLFLRCEPGSIRSIDKVCVQRGRRVLSVQPEREWLLDLSKGEPEIFSKMHPKTRYNIRLASKKNVQVRMVSDEREVLERAIDVLYGFLEKTAHSKEYRLHSRLYYRSLITIFTQTGGRISPDTPAIRLFEATVEDAVVASVCMMYFGDTAYYLYGGSDSRYSTVMAPFALHAYAIRDSMEAGYRYYNFGGISPEGADKHPLAGVTRFKTGFGGEHILYPGTLDIVLNNLGYMVYQVGRPLWRIFNRVRRP